MACHSNEITGVTNNIDHGSFVLVCSGVPVSHGSVTVGQCAHYQDPGTNAAEGIPVIILFFLKFIIYVCAFRCKMYYVKKALVKLHIFKLL